MSSRTHTTSTGNMNSDSTALANTLMERDSAGKVAAITLEAATQLSSLGSTLLRATAKSANFTADNTSTFYTVDTSSGSVTMTLPAAASSSGMVYGVKKSASGSNNLVVDPNASELIDGAATLTATAIQAALLFYCDGSGWWTLSRQGTWS